MQTLLYVHLACTISCTCFVKWLPDSNIPKDASQGCFIMPHSTSPKRFISRAGSLREARCKSENFTAGGESTRNSSRLKITRICRERFFSIASIILLRSILTCLRFSNGFTLLQLFIRKYVTRSRCNAFSFYCVKREIATLFNVRRSSRRKTPLEIFAHGCLDDARKGSSSLLSREDSNTLSLATVRPTFTSVERPH